MQSSFLRGPAAISLVLAIFFLVQPERLEAQQLIQLASSPALSPDGKRLAFSWRGDVWVVASRGGFARQLSTSPGDDGQPAFSPDGSRLAFTSDRTGSRQLYVVRLPGGVPEQLTYHSEGASLEEWFPGGQALLTNASRDDHWRHARRFFSVATEPRSGEQMLFDAYGRDGRLSPDGNRLLFTREGERWWRKGYRGSRASQIWMFDLESSEFTKLVDYETESRSPLWAADGRHFYYVGGQSGSFNLWRRDLDSGDERQITHFQDDSVVMPCISRDGSTLAFRHLSDLYRLRSGEGEKPRRLKIRFRGDPQQDPVERRVLSSASDVGFSGDGLEVAFIAGGDVWVMDTELREPRQVTDTPEQERDPLFSPDGRSLLFVSDSGGQSDLWQAERADEDRYWWQNEQFKLDRLTNDAELESEPRWLPAGDLVAFVRERGDLWVIRPDGKDARRLLRSWDRPDYDWSPDGKWLVYAVNDADFNRDVYLLPIDGSRQPFNLSRHPDNDYGPVWSPDGKAIAFSGRRVGTEVDIYYVYLQAAKSQEGSRDRKIERAIEKIQKVRKGKSAGSAGGAGKKPTAAQTGGGTEEPEPAAGGEPPPAGKGENKPGKESPANQNKKKLPEVVIDFDEIHDRIRRVSIADSSEFGLFWSHDSKKLAFAATINGRRGTYTISPPDSLEPKLLGTATGRNPKWIEQGNQIVWLANEKPASMSASGQLTEYSFSARQAVDRAARFAAAFDQCWRVMRDRYYDGNLNNRNWDAVRRKYAPLARAAVDRDMFSQVVHLMLGELNGSHLGFRSRGASSGSESWRETTAHLGLRFDRQHKGPGLLVRDVIPDGPADKVKSRIAAGETILSIDGHNVDPAMDLTSVLNGPASRDVHLKVRDADGNDRQVTLRPISYGAARERLYEKWVRDNQRAVEKASGGELGYLHIRGMNMTSFYRFERELYAVATGKQGIIIDVRENGGGSTTDHLLTVLTQPAHAITVPRGGTPGYPQDRKVYASWRKPVVVMCNQNSFSNAEIFSHAIKTLKRGQLVGVTTAGGVISTGATRIMDLGVLRVPFRGWFVKEDGQDMELNGAVPHHSVWPAPGEIPRGKDRQLEVAIGVLQKEVKQWARRPQVKLEKASQRRRE